MISQYDHFKKGHFTMTLYLVHFDMQFISLYSVIKVWASHSSSTL